MLQSQLFSKTSKTSPHDADSINARLLTQGGFIDRLMAGVYLYLPLGLRVMKNIERIIREEMDTLGGQEIFMSALSPKENYETTARWELLDDILFKFKGANKSDLCLNQSHEELVTPLAKKFIMSYRDLPRAVYQIQTKFRNEARAKSGILRGREFMMKDLYSFHATEEDLKDFYTKAIDAYFRVFKRCGLDTYIIESSGGSFTKKFSHEFQVLTEAGEDKIFICDKCKWAQNVEIFDSSKSNKCPKCDNDIREEKGIEVGNIFDLGTKFSNDFNLKYLDKDNKQHPVFMGCYGIGVSRLMGAIVESSHDDHGIIWPEPVSPFAVHLIVIHSKKSDKPKEEATKLYNKLIKDGTDVLFDDREVSAGSKFADADLYGICNRVVVSEKTLIEDSVELKKRSESDGKLVKLSELKF